MKKILFSILAVAVVLMTSCTKDSLNLNPTDQVSGDSMMDNTDGGMMALNGTIRAFWQWGWSTTGNTHQCVGPMGYSLMADLMGDDFVQAGQGNGWFFFDYMYNVKNRYTASTWRSYDCWNYYYTLISNVNYILAAKNTMQGNQADIDYIMGNAHAIRAYSLAYAAMTFARSYIGHEDRLSVPIYTEPTSPQTKGKPRATNKEVFAQAMSDIDSACILLAGQGQRHISHIGEAVANGIKARIALYMGDYGTALAAAQKAIATSSAKLTSSIFDGYNSRNGADIMWGAEVLKDQGTTNPQFMAHMDPAFEGYGDASRKCISIWLYNKISGTDLRKDWWALESLPSQDIAEGYQQKKFYFADPKNPETTDHIFMRLPEMYLIVAECQARSSQDATAQATLNEFMSYRDSKYNCTKTGTALGALTTDETGSLLEEIILQRRIELWGEFGRVYDIKRLRQGFKRTTEIGFQVGALLNNLHTDDPETFDWVLTIPQKEIDANPYMVQNPVSSYATATEGDDPALTPKVEQ